MNLEWKYIFNNNVAFSDNVNIENFNSNNSLLLDNVEEEQKNTFLGQVAERIQEANQKEMQELDLEEDENPLIQSIPLYNMFKYASNDINNSNMSEEEISAFNSKFEMYEGTNMRGTTVRGLLTTIASNNGLDDEEENTDNNEFGTSIQNQGSLIEEIHFDGEEYDVTKQNITYIKSTIETESYYRVEFEKNESDGKIYRVVINKK